MKPKNFKIFWIPLSILIIDLVLSLPQFNVKPGPTGALRLLFIPALLYTFVDLFKTISVKHFDFAILKSSPWVILLVLFIFQIFAIPAPAVPMHISGCVKFISWSLMFICSLLSINPENAPKIRKVIVCLLLLIFVGTIIQYPVIISRSVTSLSELIAAYGTQEKEGGLFLAGNEDANSSVTLLPLVLLYLKKVPKPKRFVFLFLLLSYFTVVLFFNGTRTALFMTFPLMVFLFYFNLSLKSLSRLVPFLAGGLLFYQLYLAEFVQRAFSRETEGEGTMAFRIERAWIPASTYTYEQSPIWGFGSRGWEYVGNLLQIVRGLEEESSLEVIPAHNVYVWAYVCWGAVGLVCYLLFLLILLKDTLELSFFPDPEIAGLGKALFCSMISYCIWAGISNAYIEAGWGILLSIGILAASLKVSASSMRRQYTSPSPGV